jgi:molybdate transport system ATP-binding protein/molybdate/tungstate transport system ATP-binding protein
MLIINKLSKKYGNFFLKPISFSLQEKDFMCIIGSTGSGKTLIVDMISGIKNPDSGKITLNGKNLLSIPIHKRDVSVVYQDSFLFPHMNVKDNIKYGLKHKKIKGFDFDYIVDFFKISHLLNRNISNLSGGEKQRVALARAIIVRPELLILDEPLSAVDETLRPNMLGMIKRVHDELGIMTIMVTHNLNDLWMVADKVLLVENGRQLQFGKVNELFFSPSNAEVAKFVKMTNVFTLDKNEFKKFFNVSPYKFASDFVKMGIRPEDIEIISSLDISKLTMEATIHKIVNEGPYFSIYAYNENKKFHCIVSKNELKNNRFSENQKVYLKFDPEKIHIFGSENEKN